jgi:hypothetical protein
MSAQHAKTLNGIENNNGLRKIFSVILITGTGIIKNLNKLFLHQIFRDLDRIGGSAFA